MDKNNISKMGNMKNIQDMLVLRCLGALDKCDRFLQDTHIYEDIIKLCNYITSNPVFLTIFLTSSIAVFVPLLFFVTFAIINTIFAFAGFIIIQVGVLAIAASILSCVLFCVVTTLGLIDLSILVIYYVGRYIGRLLKVS